MVLATDIAIFAVSVVVLALAGQALVRSLFKISSFLHIREYALAFIVMAFATSIPELFVGISSALSETTELAIGNVIGSNIADMTLVLGITILLARRLRIKDSRIKKDAWLILGVAALPFIMLIDGVIGRVDAVVLLAVFVLYLVRLISKRKNKAHALGDRVSRWNFLGHVLLFLGAIVALFIAADFIVNSAIEISSALNLPLLLIGLIIPE